MNKQLLSLCISLAACTITQAQTNYSWNNLPVIKQPVFKKDTISIVQYGAKTGLDVLNTASINNAIAACSAKGGGVVMVPAGLWLTGPIELKSNVNLYLQRAALLQFTDDFNQYKLVEGNWEGKPSMRNQSPISGTNLENIAITGSGIIDGNGDAWRAVSKDKLPEPQWKRLVASGGVLSADGRTWYPSEKSKLGNQTKDAAAIVPGKTAKDYEAVKDFLRPNLLVLTNCKKVLLEGVTFQNSPAWCLHPLMCEDVTLRNVYAKNPEYAQNGDGVDVESCKNVLIEGCTFDVGDDGICIKSGRDEAGRKRGMPTENAVIRNNVVYHAHGGFVVGSEMSGGARNLFVYDCTFMGTDIGLRFKTTRGRGGIVEKIYVKNISMKNIVHEAILFDMYYFAKPPAGPGNGAQEPPVPPVTEATPQFRDFDISNVTCDGAERGIFVRGLPEMNIQSIRLRDISIKAGKGAALIEAQHISLSNIQLITVDTQPVISIENSSGLVFDNIRYNDGAALLFDVRGKKSNNIQVLHTNTGKAASAAAYNYGATAAAMQIQ